jgi:hypothetical protein
MKLWAAGKPVDAHLIERLSDRRLRKPIELCILCSDPVQTSGTLEVIESLVAENEAFRRLVAPSLDAVVTAIRAATPNPTELLLISVLRHGPRERHSHAVAVTAIALALASTSAIPERARERLVHAGMLHDVGELYMDPQLFEGRLSSDMEQRIMEHPVLGSRAVLELARSGHDVAQAIRQSHERLDGSGYPDAAKGDAITPLARPLLVAEAIAALLLDAEHGLVRASIATRLVPGEFPREYVNVIHAQSRHTVFSEMLTDVERRTVSETLVWARDVSHRIAADLQANTPPQRSVEEGALLARVESILWSVQKSISATGAVEALSGVFALEEEGAHAEFEARAVADEVTYRLRRLVVELSGALESDLSGRARTLLEEIVASLARDSPG